MTDNTNLIARLRHGWDPAVAAQAADALVQGARDLHDMTVQRDEWFHAHADREARIAEALATARDWPNYRNDALGAAVVNVLSRAPQGAAETRVAPDRDLINPLTQEQIAKMVDDLYDSYEPVYNEAGNITTSNIAAALFVAQGDIPSQSWATRRTVAKHMARVALDWAHIDCGSDDHDLDHTNWEAYLADAETLLSQSPQSAAEPRLAPDREALAQLLADTDPDWKGMPWEDCSDPIRNEYRKWADVLLASGVLGVPADRHDNLVRAEALEALATNEAAWTARAWRPEEAETVVKLSKAIKARAAEYRKAEGK